MSRPPYEDPRLSHVDTMRRRLFARVVLPVAPGNPPCAIGVLPALRACQMLATRPLPLTGNYIDSRADPGRQRRTSTRVPQRHPDHRRPRRGEVHHPRRDRRLARPHHHSRRSSPATPSPTANRHAFPTTQAVGPRATTGQQSRRDRYRRSVNDPARTARRVDSPSPHPTARGRTAIRKE